MKCCSPNWLTSGGVMAGLAVVAGAFAAHGLDGYFVSKYSDRQPKVVAGLAVPASWKYLEDFKTGARYQMYHAWGLIAVGLLSHNQTQTRTSLQVAGWCFLLGILLFSGSLYGLTLTGQKWLGAIAPIGGVLMILGWLALGLSAKRVSARNPD